MIRLLLFLCPFLFLMVSADAEAQALRRRPPPNHLRRPPPPGAGAPCRSGNCSLTGLVDDVQTVTQTQGSSTQTTTAPATTSSSTSTQTSTAVSDATALSDFPNDATHANVQAMLEFAAEHYGIPVELLMATAWTESEWTQWKSGGDVLVGGGVDYGLMQINQDTWAGTYDWTKITGDVRENIRAGAEILKWSYDYAKGKGYTGSKLAQAAYAVYNGGPDAVHRPWDTSSPWRQNDLNFESAYNGRSWENNS